ncbi:hypothetical protein B0T16DRAFT_319899 [Cercophora newfieldiana]|uniref:Regulator of G protein signaling superfamily n=1 Tax=Cercophora newfieldiana TaxID=92897 RepID=A0AA40D098_9PEZI|nr:hypothetical protein B0T16DRAFT_319899 [Cercophora newfieldiana]
MGLLPLNYRRPSYVPGTSRTMSDDQISVGSGGSGSADGEKSSGSLRPTRSATVMGVPDALGFDKIIEGGTCPPCTTRDFMNYLIYVERSAENLQFFLWYRDYVKRFSEAKTSDMALSLEWTQAMEEDAIARIQKEQSEKIRKETKTPAIKIFNGTDFEKRTEFPKAPASDTNPFSSPPQTPYDRDGSSEYVSSTEQSYRSQANEAFTSAGIKAPFTIQPFRKEIDRVIATYIIDGAPRQLNLSDREQKVVLHALAYTTHPSALREVSKLAESILRRQAHPNFIRWSICNGNPARVFFARALGSGLIVISTAIALALTLSGLGRGYRALAAIGWVLGIATLIAAWKGMCVVLHGMHHHHVRPWELFVSEEDADSLGKRSFDSFGSSNSYEEQPWVIRYQKRNIIRKIFDREVWIQEPALRQIQDTIFVQSMLCALLIAGVSTAIFVAVPGGNFF